MKIRIKGNSVRYRLTRSEVEQFSIAGFLEEKTEFPNGVLKYRLKAKSGIDNLDAELDNNTITLFFPDDEKSEWYTSDRVGYQNTIKTPGGQPFGLLLEKDFVCLDKVDEDQSDNYPNPNLVC